MAEAITAAVLDAEIKRGMALLHVDSLDVSDAAKANARHLLTQVEGFSDVASVFPGDGRSIVFEADFRRRSLRIDLLADGQVEFLFWNTENMKSIEDFATNDMEHVAYMTRAVVGEKSHG